MSSSPTDQQRDRALDVAELVRLHHGALYAYAFRLTGAQQDAEDLVQQVFLTAQKKGYQVRRQDSVRSWLFTVLRNHFLKDCRRQTPQLAENLEISLGDLPDDSHKGEIWFDQEKLQLAINELAPEFKLVVLMFYFEELSYKDIADRLDVPMGTVMSRLSRAKSHLRKMLGGAEMSAAAAARHNS